MKPKTGSRLAPSVAVENALYNEVRPLVAAMFERTDRALKVSRLRFVREPVEATFKRHGRAITRDFINRVVAHTRSAFKAATKGFEAKAKDNLESRATLKRLERRWEECESLIRDIPTKFFDKLDLAVRSANEGLMTKAGFELRYEELKRQVYGRLRLIANTQNARATEALLVSRCVESGITRVKWCHTHLPEIKPRDYHLRKWDGHSGKRNGKPNGLNGYVFDIDKPPVIDLKTGERGYPAQLVNCKCYLVPVEE